MAIAKHQLSSSDGRSRPRKLMRTTQNDTVCDHMPRITQEDSNSFPVVVRTSCRGYKALQRSWKIWRRIAHMARHQACIYGAPGQQMRILRATARKLPHRARCRALPAERCGQILAYSLDEGRYRVRIRDRH